MAIPHSPVPNSFGSQNNHHHQLIQNVRSQGQRSPLQMVMLTGLTALLSAVSFTAWWLLSF